MMNIGLVMQALLLNNRIKLANGKIITITKVEVHKTFLCLRDIKGNEYLFGLNTEFDFA